MAGQNYQSLQQPFQPHYGLNDTVSPTGVQQMPQLQNAIMQANRGVGTLAQPNITPNNVQANSWNNPMANQGFSTPQTQQFGGTQVPAQSMVTQQRMNPQMGLSQGMNNPYARTLNR